MKRSRRPLERSFESCLPGEKAVACVSFQPLESRVFLSGTVIASVDHGSLIIRGGNAASSVVLDQNGLNSDQVRITTSGNTTLNAQIGPVILSGVTRGLSVRFGAGADSVTLNDMNLPGNVAVNVGGGANVVTLDNAQIAGNLDVESVGNVSTVDLLNSTVGKNLTIGGGQNFALKNATVNRDTFITGGPRPDTATIDNSTFHGVVALQTGRGNDFIQLGAYGDPQGAPNLFDGRVRITTGDGSDILQLGVAGEASDRSTFAKEVFFNGGRGTDTLRNFELSSYLANSQFQVRDFESIITNPDITAPTVSSTDPANNAVDVPLNKKFAATFSEPMDPATISTANVTLMAPGSVSVPGTVDYTGTTMIFTPTAGLAPNTAYSLTISTGVKDLAGNELAANYVSTFTTGAIADTTAPTVSSTDPANNAAGVALNKKVAATFSESMDPLTINTTNVLVTAPGSVPVSGTVSDVGATMNFTPTNTLAPNTVYTVTITTGAKDLAGNALASNYVWSFTSGATPDTTAPTVVSTNPANNATAVPLNQAIAATFSEAMDPLTINPADVTVTSPGLVPVAGTVNYVGTTMTFTPTSSLPPTTTFTATITTGATDLAGNALPSNYVWTFTTGATPDVTPPTVTSTNPSNLKTNFALNKTVAATFSEAIEPLTITAATFTVTGPGSTPVNGTVNYNSTSDVATFTPSSNLAPSTTFTATITGGANGVKDLAGNALSSNDVWTFTTGTQIAQPPVNLGSAGTFAIMATDSISGTGFTQITGDVGLNPGSSQGIPPSEINGTIHIDDQAVRTAQSDLLAGYNDATSRSTTSQTLPGNMGGLTFTPGLYTNSSSVLIQGAGPANNVTLDAQGDPNAIFIFQMGSTLTTGPGAQVILAGGAKATNVFWQVGTSATLNTTTIFNGNILAATTITVNGGSIVNGRLLAGINTPGSVTVNASTVTVPSA